MVAYYQDLGVDHVEEGWLALRWKALPACAEPDLKGVDQLRYDITECISAGGGSALIELRCFVEKWRQSLRPDN